MNIFNEFERVEKKAYDFGFVWQGHQHLLEEMREEEQQIERLAAEACEHDKELLQKIIGEHIHSLACLAYMFKIRPEEVFQESIRHFEQRLDKVIELAKQDEIESLKGKPYEIQKYYWTQAKAEIK